MKKVQVKVEKSGHTCRLQTQRKRAVRSSKGDLFCPARELRNKGGVRNSLDATGSAEEINPKGHFPIHENLRPSLHFNLESRISNHSVGTRCLSSSNQFTMILMLRGPSAASGFPGDSTFFIIRKRLPSGQRSHMCPAVEKYLPRKSSLGTPALNTVSSRPSAGSG